jgi:membrane fusion protein (multidrug efflux system)
VDGKAARQKVEIGQRRDSRVEIVSGLGSGDVVVTEGHLKMREGVAVKVTQTPGSAPTQPALNTGATKGKG